MIFIFSLFFYLIGSHTEADLYPPFKQDLEGKINYWEFGGATIIDENEIMLVPPIQYTRGCAWTNVEIPKTDFSIEYKFKISEGSGGGGIGFWFVSDYMTTGSLCGSANVFKGIGFIAQIVKKTENTIELLFYSCENDGTVSINLNELTDPYFSIETSPGVPISLLISFVGDKIILSESGDKLLEIERPKKLDDNYIGISASSDLYTSRIDLLGVDFALGEEVAKKARKVSNQNQQPSHYNPKDTGYYRSPVLRITSEEAAMHEGDIKKSATVDRVFSVIDELNELSYGTASYPDVNQFVKQKIIPYAEKWHRRTLKLVDRVKQARNIMTSAYNYTNQIMEDFNSTLQTNYLKTTNKVFDLAPAIVDDGKNGMDRYDELSTMDKAPTATKAMIFISVIEIIILVVGILFAQKRY